MFDYLFKENLIYLTFKEFNYENLYLDLIEKQILKNKYLKIEIDEKNNLLIINFIKILNNKYKINDNNYLCVLLSFCNINLLLNIEIY